MYSACLCRKMPPSILQKSMNKLHISHLFLLCLAGQPAMAYLDLKCTIKSIQTIEARKHSVQNAQMNQCHQNVKNPNESNKPKHTISIEILGKEKIISISTGTMAYFWTSPSYCLWSRMIRY